MGPKSRLASSTATTSISRCHLLNDQTTVGIRGLPFLSLPPLGSKVMSFDARLTLLQHSSGWGFASTYSKESFDSPADHRVSYSFQGSSRRNDLGGPLGSSSLVWDDIEDISPRFPAEPSTPTLPYSDLLRQVLNSLGLSHLLVEGPPPTTFPVGRSSGRAPGNRRGCSGS